MNRVHTLLRAQSISKSCSFLLVKLNIENLKKVISQKQKKFWMSKSERLHHSSLSLLEIPKWSKKLIVMYGRTDKFSHENASLPKTNWFEYIYIRQIACQDHI